MCDGRRASLVEDEEARASTELLVKGTRNREEEGKKRGRKKRKGRKKEKKEKEKRKKKNKIVLGFFRFSFFLEFKF